MIVIVDYQAGNIGSIRNMIKKLGSEAVISSEHSVINQASKLILPGVGSFDYGMSKLKDLGLIEVLNRKVIENKVPVLGICLGAQLMCRSSEEGTLQGLSWIGADVKRFPIQSAGVKYTVPHMGWDAVQIRKRSSRLFLDVQEPARFYFVHSYYIECDDESDVLTANKYSVSYHSAFERGNILGVQYHPEKSHKFGRQMLKNFLVNY